jgi:hypothetical protein
MVLDTGRALPTSRSWCRGSWRTVSGGRAPDLTETGVSCRRAGAPRRDAGGVASHAVTGHGKEVDTAGKRERGAASVLQASHVPTPNSVD